MPEPAPATISDDGLIQPVCSVFRRFLKRQGLKFTSERAHTLNAVLSRKDVFEADELMQEMRTAGHRVSKATIYRTLKHLTDAGIIAEVLIDPRQTHYELSFGRTPRGYLVCVETGRVVQIPSPWLEPVRKRICQEHGFEALSHRFVIYGLSPEAQRDREDEA